MIASTTESHAAAIEILQVEDSPGDAQLTQEALRDASMPTHLHLAPDGFVAMAYLRRETGHADAPRPNLILLDLNLPRKDGRQILAEIKSDANLKTIPVIVLTTSSAERDILQSYELQANCYITKPVDLEGFMRVIKSVENFWFSVVKFPPCSTY